MSALWQYRRCVLWIKVGSVECGKLVDLAACVCATIDYSGPTATWSAIFAHFKCSVNSCLLVTIPTVDLLPTVYV